MRVEVVSRSMQYMMKLFQMTRFLKRRYQLACQRRDANSLQDR
jgi:hypothetical protein